MAVDAAEILTPTIVNGLPTGWNWKRLDSVCEGVFDCPHSTPSLTQEGPFVARSQDMRSGVFRTEEAGHVSVETYRERVARAEPKYGDVLYSREGTYFGIAADVPPGIQVCLGQRMVLLRPRADEVNFRFLRYWLNSPVMAMYAHGFRDGTVAERLNLPMIRALRWDGRSSSRGSWTSTLSARRPKAETLDCLSPSETLSRAPLRTRS